MILALLACSTPPETLEGVVGAACYPNDTCNDGLVCTEGVCERGPLEGDTDTDADTDSDTDADSDTDTDSDTDADTDTDTDPDTTDIGEEHLDFSWDTVQIVNAIDVRDFAITSHITDIAFWPGTFHIDHELRGQWPSVVIDPDGTTQEATVWIFFRIDGVWYGTGGERLRPDQNEKELANPSDIGSEWFYDGSWAPMSGYVPLPGETVGFMIVQGQTRTMAWDVTVEERTAVVLVPFPADGVSVDYTSFLWEEPG